MSMHVEMLEIYTRAVTPPARPSLESRIKDALDVINADPIAEVLDVSIHHIYDGHVTVMIIYETEDYPFREPPKLSFWDRIKILFTGSI